MVPLLIMAYGQSNADRYIAKPRLDSEILSDMSVITLTSGLGVRGRAYAPDGRLHKNRIAEFTIDGKRVADEGAPRVLPATYHEGKGTALLLSAGAVASALTNAPLTGVRAASKGGAAVRIAAGPRGCLGHLPPGRWQHLAHRHRAGRGCRRACRPPRPDRRPPGPLRHPVPAWRGRPLDPGRGLCRAVPRGPRRDHAAACRTGAHPALDPDPARRHFAQGRRQRLAVAARDPDGAGR